MIGESLQITHINSGESSMGQCRTKTRDLFQKWSKGRVQQQESGQHGDWHHYKIYNPGWNTRSIRPFYNLVKNQFCVESYNNESRGPCQYFNPVSNHKFTHFA